MGHRLPIDQIISQLGYDLSDNLYFSDEFDSAHLTPHSRRILEEIHPHAAYIINNEPFILFFNENINDENLFRTVSKQVWNAQIPVVFFCDESVVKIFNGTSLQFSTDTIAQIETCTAESLNENSDFSYWKISEPAFWNGYLQDYSATKLNQVLLNNISFLTNELKNAYGIPFATKLVLRLIFIRYLIDRGVDLDYAGFTTDVSQSQAEFLRIVGNKAEVYKLFSHLKAKFNGNLFELDDEIICPELVESTFELLFAFFSGKEVFGQYGKQQSLFKLYDFNIIPIELISSIYEILLGDKTRDKDNAFYTPNYLVEYILDKTISKGLKSKNEVKVLDPACGSGAFLVDSYRRIIQKNLGEKTYCDDDTKLKNLLTNNVFGIDINEEAIDVTTFSLYLTILDYKDPKSLSEFTLPNLKGKNLFASDFFDEEYLEFLANQNVEFDYIIGNPPWGNVKNGLHMTYCRKRGYEDKQQNNDIGRSFVFRAKDFCSVKTVCCFVLHSKLLYNQKGPAVNFRKWLLEEAEICEIVELSSVRELVFENAKAPAAIIAFKYSNQDNLNNEFLYTSVKPNIFFKLFHVICVEKSDIKYVPQSFLHNYDWAWKTIVYGYSRDLENILKLKSRYQTLGEAIEKQEPAIIMGAGVECQDGDKKDASHLLTRKLLDSKKGVDHFFINSSAVSDFNKPKIHRPRDKRLFDPPYVLTPTGIDCSNYKLRAAYSEEAFVAKKTMYIIKGAAEQKRFLMCLVGLLNSSLYAYLNLLLGSSIGVEREQRLMDEVLKYPFVYSEEIAEKADYIQKALEQASRQMLQTYDVDDDIRQLDRTVLSAVKLEGDNFVDYAVNVQIPELAGSDNGQAYKKICANDLKEYSECFLKHFSTIFKNGNHHMAATLYPAVGINYAVFELRIVEGRGESEVAVINSTDDEKSLFTKFAVYAHNDKFYQIRDIIHFGTDSFFIIKPNIYKNWHPAMAELDLADVVEDIMSALGGD